ncbi:hypothetical protein [Sphaerisporangium fuscum]|uniref:hypothetical protein n=1 Tax=Sphaerisporangium fuscum TaxID=2835868 RepID=UPI001BDCD1B9|nr:hypothetical protein [Sphaerisporangium fuscum]
MTTMRVLRAAAAFEAASLVVLFGNLFTVHVKAISTLVGPLHGMCYLGVVVATALVPAAPSGARWRALVPGIGGALALRRLRSHGGELRP